MTLTGNVVINAYSAVILLIVYFQNARSRKQHGWANKLYVAMIHTGMLMLFLDVLSRLDGHAHMLFPSLNAWGNALAFFLTPLLPSLWVLYAHYSIFRSRSKLKPVILGLAAVFAAHGLLSVMTLFRGWFYYIDADNVYHRGPWYLMSASVPIVLLLAAFILILVQRKRIEQRSFLPLVLFAVPPFICIILQSMFYGVSLILNGAALSLLIIHLNVQSINLNTDYLTGINNRLRLEQYLQEKMENSMPGRTFSAILLDFDNFKSINDTLGHSMGDDALITAADLFSRHLRPHDFLARYGGDEFCIVLDTPSSAELEQVVRRLKQTIEVFNRKTAKPYRLRFSTGAAVYDAAQKPDLKEFFESLDERMYTQKKEHKRLRTYQETVVLP